MDYKDLETYHKYQQIGWHEFFLGMAKYVSKKSKDPSTKVGCVIVDDRWRVVSVGYNGFPKGITDDERLNDREIKYQMVLHAEQNAILFAERCLKGCTIYTWPFQPCSICASTIIQAGIKRVVTVPNTTGRWEENFELARKNFMDAGVEFWIEELPNEH